MRKGKYIKYYTDIIYIAVYTRFNVNGFSLSFCKSRKLYFTLYSRYYYYECLNVTQCNIIYYIIIIIVVEWDDCCSSIGTVRRTAETATLAVIILHIDAPVII